LECKLSQKSKQTSEFCNKASTAGMSLVTSWLLTVQLSGLRDEERLRIHRIAMGTICRAALAGGISAAISGVAEWGIGGLLNVKGDGVTYLQHQDADVTQLVVFWIVVAAIAFITSCLEMLWIYYNVLTATAKCSELARLKLFPSNPERLYIALSLARSGT
jgi:hypothetical protein